MHEQRGSDTVTQSSHTGIDRLQLRVQWFTCREAERLWVAASLNTENLILKPGRHILVKEDFMISSVLIVSLFTLAQQYMCFQTHLYSGGGVGGAIFRITPRTAEIVQITSEGLTWLCRLLIVK